MDSGARPAINDADKSALALEILRSLQDGLVAYDAQLRFLSVNPAAERLLGVKESEAVGRSHWEVFPADLGTALESEYRSAMAERVPATFENLYESGRKRCEVQVTPSESGGLIARIREITDSKHAASLVPGAALFPEQNPFPVLRIRRDGTLLYANRSAARLQEEWQTEVGRGVPELVRQSVESALANSVPEDLEIESGGRCFSFAVAPLSDLDCANLYGRDVTEHKKADEALHRLNTELEERVAEQAGKIRQAYELLDSFLKGTKDIIHTIDTRFRLTSCNQAFKDAVKRAYGQDVEIGMSLAEVLVNFPEDRERTFRTWARALTGESFTVEQQFGDPGRDRRRYEIDYSPIRDERGQIVGVAHMAHDVTARRLAEEQAAAERQRLHDVLEMLPAYAVLLTPDHHVPFANRFFRERFGESNGRRCYEYLFGRSEPCEVCGTFTVLKTSVPHRWEWVGPDGRNYDIHDFPFRDTDGSTLIMEVGLDVTERKKAEAELVRHRDHLAELVSERTGQLEAAIEELQAEIAERKRAEEDLWRNREWLRVTLTSIGDAVIATDSEGRITFANPMATCLTGWGPEEILGQPFQSPFNIINEKTREPVEDLFSCVLRERRPVTLSNHTALVRKDGREIPIEDSAAPILDATGEIAGVVVVFHDVTEKRRAQARLAAAYEDLASEKHRLEAVMQTLPVGVSITDAQGGNARANAEFEDIWGGPMLPAQSVRDYAAYKAWWADTGRPVRPEEWASARAVQKGEIVVGQELEIERFDGTRAFVLNSAAPIRGAQGQILGSAVAILDITAHKRAEDRIRHDNAVLEGINRILGEALSHEREEDLGRVCLDVAEELTQSKFGFVGEIDAQGRLVAIAVSGPGWGPSASEGRASLPATFVLHRIYGRVLLDVLDGKGLYTNEPASAPYHIGTLEGHPPLAAFLGVPLVQDGKTIGMIAVGNREGGYRRQDLETLEALAVSVVQSLMRKRAELALRQSRADLTRAQAVAHTGSWRLDIGRNELAWSDETYRLFGIPAGTPLTYETFLGAVHPDDRDLVDRSWQAALRGEPYDIEHRIIVDGAVRWVRERAELLLDRQGTLLGGFGTVQDFTEHKLLELERELRARLKDEFLAVLGHELRNPLATISTAVRLITSGVSDERRTALDEMMGRQVAVLQRLVDDLLDLARAIHGQTELKRDRVDLSQFLQKTAEAARSSIAGHHQELVLRLPAEHVAFMADVVRLEQVVVNLLNNASKYTGPGGSIELSGARDGSEVVIRCKDNGRGIPWGMREMIFEPFTRVRVAGESTQAGVGIGLALVKRLVELHGGTVSAESAGPGTGSEFVVRLPLVEPPPAPADAGEAERRPRTRLGLSIVVVEDNPDVAQSLAIALEQAGHRVHVFADGPSALSGTAVLKPNAVLLDIGLPGIDGYELAARLRREPDFQHTLFIGLSGFKRRAQAGKVVDDFDHYFVKPADPVTLLALLEKHARGKKSGGAEARRTAKQLTVHRVLLVEDHAELAAVTAELLRQAGLEVRTALSGREALEAAAGFQPELVLCDLHLPDMPGEELVRALRATPAVESARVVILTALQESEIAALRRGAKHVGIDQFLSKPLTPEKLSAILGRLKPRRPAL